MASDQWAAHLTTTFNNEHNHPPLLGLSLAILRRLDEEQRKFVEDHLRQGSSVRHTLRFVRNQFPCQLLLPNDIANIRFQLRATDRAGHTATEACIDQAIAGTNDLTAVKVAPTSLISNLQMNIPNVPVVYQAALKSKHQLSADGAGEHHAQFRQVIASMAELKRTDPADYYDVYRVENKVQQVFFASSAIQQTSRHTRPYVAVDAAFSKTISDYHLYLATT